MGANGEEIKRAKATVGKMRWTADTYRSMSGDSTRTTIRPLCRSGETVTSL